jgi:DNA polymerase III alpha subunit (gram-positive type)
MVFDTETGGLDPESDSLLSIGIVVGDLDTGEIIDKFEGYIKLDSIEDYQISPSAFEVHGISAEQCMREGVSKNEMQDKFMDMYHENNCVLLAGHNAPVFDVPFVSYGLFGIPPKDLLANLTYRILDSMPIIRIFAGTEGMKQGATLKQTTKSLNIDMSDITGGYHAALYDSIATFRILYKFRTVLTSPEFVERIKK